MAHLLKQSLLMMRCEHTIEHQLPYIISCKPIFLRWGQHSLHTHIVKEDYCISIDYCPVTSLLECLIPARQSFKYSSLIRSPSERRSQRVKIDKKYSFFIPMKPLLPSLREKKRYVAYEVLADIPVTQEDAEAAITESARTLMGTLQFSQAAFEPVKWSKQRGIIRVNRQYVNHTKSALALTSTINNKKVLVRSLGISGMIGKAETKFIR